MGDTPPFCAHVVVSMLAGSVGLVNVYLRRITYAHAQVKNLVLTEERIWLVAHQKKEVACGVRRSV